MKYFKPKSVSWWAGIAEAAVNLIRAFGYPIPIEVDGFIGSVFAIGIRGALK